MMTKQEVSLRDKTYLLPDMAREPKAGESGYALALHCAGVDVLDFENFGSYQGEWWARVQFPSGEIFFVPGSYGSCSGCDAFEAEFEWDSDERPDYAHRLRDFGREYLTNCYTLQGAIIEASKNLSWDHDAEEMVEWLRKFDATRAALAEADNNG